MANYLMGWYNAGWEDDELPDLVNGLEILHYQQGWAVSGRHDALVVAQKPASSST